MGKPGSPVLDIAGASDGVNHHFCYLELRIELYVDNDSRLQKVIADNGETIMIRQAEPATAAADAEADP